MKKTGNNIYTVLKKNNSTVWAISIFSSVCVIGSLLFAFLVWQESQSNLFTINETGEVVPLSKLEDKEADLIQAKANIELFVNNYLSLDAYSMKRKRERVLWLVGEQPTKIIKDRASKGYFDDFLSIAGLTQNAYILQQTMEISKEAPYKASFVVRIQRVNGGVIEEYNDFINLTMEKVNKNYPYNPYGLLITQISENLRKVDSNSSEAEEEVKKSEEEINQNPQENE